MGGNVHQEDEDRLKATVKQKEKDRTISEAVTIIQAVAANLKATVTQAAKDRSISSMPNVTQNDPELLKSEVFQADIARLRGTVRLTDGINYVGYARDYKTGIVSIATSRGIGKSSYTHEFEGDITDAEIITTSWPRKIQVTGMLTCSDSDAGDVKISLSDKLIWAHYFTKFKTQGASDMAAVGDLGDPVLITSTPGAGKHVFVLINYRDLI